MSTQNRIAIAGAVIIVAAISGAATPTEEYAAIASKIYLGKSPGSRTLEPISSDAFRGLVGNLDQLIEREVGAALNSSPTPTSKQIVGRINDIQGDYASTGFFGQGGPFAAGGPQDMPPTFAVGFAVMAGGLAIPTPQPTIAFFVKDTGGWKLKAETSDDLRDLTLDMQQVNSKMPGQMWLLVSGRRTGDTGARLNVRLYSFDGAEVKSLWSRDALVAGSVLVEGDSITLEYDEQYHTAAPRVVEKHYLAPSGVL